MIILNKIKRKDYLCEERETVVFTLKSGRTVYTAKVMRPCYDSRSSLEVKKGDLVVLQIPHLETCFIEFYSLKIHDLAHGDKKALMLERLQNCFIYLRHKVAIYTAQRQKAA